jgi:uncharacterized membrane protein
VIIKTTREQRILFIAALVFWLLCCLFALQRYFAFYPTYVAFDQGIFNQVFWNTLHGRWFESSLSSTESINVIQDGEFPDVSYRRLGQHFTPALLLWVPYYALVQSPAGLSVLQITLIAAAGIVLYALARQHLAPPLALMIALSYYCANAVIAPAVANFHDISQVPLYLFSLLLALEKRWWGLLWPLAVLTLLVREDAGIVLFSIGAYFVLSRRHPWVGGGLCAMSLGYVVLATTVLMPMFSDDISRRFMVEQFGHFIDNQEATTLQVLGAIARQPLGLLQELVSPPARTLNFVLGQALPLAFVSLLSPSTWVLIAAPLFKTLIRQDSTALSLHLRYALYIVPGLFYGAIVWWAAHPQFFQPRVRQFWRLCMVLALVLTLTSNPNRALSVVIPDSFQPWVYASPAQQWQHAQAMRSMMARIPNDASVSATGYAIAHLSNRRAAVRYPEIRIREDDGVDKTVQFILIDLWYPQLFEPAFIDERNTLIGMSWRINEWLEGDRYGLRDFRDGIALLRRNADTNPNALSRWRSFDQQLQPLMENAES